MGKFTCSLVVPLEPRGIDVPPFRSTRAPLVGRFHVAPASEASTRTCQATARLAHARVLAVVRAIRACHSARGRKLAGHTLYLLEPTVTGVARAAFRTACAFLCLGAPGGVRSCWAGRTRRCAVCAVPIVGTALKAFGGSSARILPGCAFFHTRPKAALVARGARRAACSRVKATAVGEAALCASLAGRSPERRPLIVGVARRALAVARGGKLARRALGCFTRAVARVARRTVSARLTGCAVGGAAGRDRATGTGVAVSSLGRRVKRVFTTRHARAQPSRGVRPRGAHDLGRPPRARVAERTHGARRVGIRIPAARVASRGAGFARGCTRLGVLGIGAARSARARCVGDELSRGARCCGAAAIAGVPSETGTAGRVRVVPSTGCSLRRRARRAACCSRRRPLAVVPAV